MKKYLAVLCAAILCCIMSVAFTGCGKDDSDKGKTSTTQPTTEYNIEQDDNVVEDPF